MQRALAMIAFLFACSSASGPAEPVWGKQPCEHCMMLLSDRHTAAQAELSDGAHLYFDDFGCMVEWLARGNANVRVLWVRAPGEARWIDASAARYASGQRTPMDYGIVPAHEGMSFEAARAVVVERAARRSEVRP